MKPAPLIIGIAALGGLGYYLTTQSADGGTLGGGSTTSNTAVQPGGVVTPGGDSTDDDSGSEPETIAKKWKKRGEISWSYSRRPATSTVSRPKSTPSPTPMLLARPLSSPSVPSITKPTMATTGGATAVAVTFRLDGMATMRF